MPTDRSSPPDGGFFLGPQSCYIDAANSVATQRRLADHLVENLCRFREGRPLLGLVDKAAGY